jgi:hypothetical protein
MGIRPPWEYPRGMTKNLPLPLRLFLSVFIISAPEGRFILDYRQAA